MSSTTLPTFTMQELLDAGVHFGHKTMRWNPRMEPYIYGVRNGIHIIDLQKTMPLLYRALKALNDVASKNGRVLFVGTKRQASFEISEAAKRSGQYYVDHRWLGGMLTNWNTISNSIRTLRDLEEQLGDSELHLSKKERLTMDRQRDKLERSLGGIKDMGGLPDILFVVDTNKEHLAIDEARVLGIPVVAIVDSNSNPEGISHIVPGNDDATRAIQLYCRLASDAILAGVQTALANSGVDVGASADAGADGKRTVVQKVKSRRRVTADEAQGAEAPEASEGSDASEGKGAKPAGKKPAAKPAGKPAVKAAPARGKKAASDESEEAPAAKRKVS